MLKELRSKVKKLMPHRARDVMMTQAARVFDDRRSGKHSDAAKEAAEKAAAPPAVLTAVALNLVASWAKKEAAKATAAATHVTAQSAAIAGAAAADRALHVGGSQSTAGEAANTAASASADATTASVRCVSSARASGPLATAPHSHTLVCHSCCRVWAHCVRPTRRSRAWPAWSECV